MKAHIYSFVFLAVLGMVYALTECPAEDGDEAVSVVNPADCSSFYLCNNGEYVLTACSTGLEYNEELGVCDWPANANCVVTEAAEEVESEAEAEAEAEAESEAEAEAEAEK